MSEDIEIRFTISGKLPEGMMFDRDRFDRAVMAGGQRMSDDLADYYRIQDVYEPNRFVREGTGARRTHFWNQVAESVGAPVRTDDGVRVSILDRRIKQKVYGGTILPKRAKFLTVPIHPDAYARTAGELFSLIGRMFVLTAKSGKKFLAQRDGKDLTLYYRLMPSVTQEPWPTAMPSRKFLTDSFRNGVRYFLSRE